MSTCRHVDGSSEQRNHSSLVISLFYYIYLPRRLLADPSLLLLSVWWMEQKEQESAKSAIYRTFRTFSHFWHFCSFRRKEQNQCRMDGGWSGEEQKRAERRPKAAFSLILLIKSVKCGPASRGSSLFPALIWWMERKVVKSEEKW